MEKLKDYNIGSILSSLGDVLKEGKEVIIENSPLQVYINELKEMKVCYEAKDPVRMEEDLLFK